MLMKFEDKGWCYAFGAEIEVLKSQGWTESSEEERQEIIACKNKPKEVKSIIVEPLREAQKGKPGRKPKNYMASLGNGHCSADN